MRKRGITTTTLATLFIAIVSFLVIWLVIDVIKTQAEGRTAEELCRMSIVAREKTGVQPEIKGIKGPEVEVAPLLCSTAKSEDVKDMTKEEVEKYIADKMTRCWYKYQEGNVEDVFKGSTFTTKCQICQPFNVKKWKDYKQGDKITNEELVVFMYSNVYKIREDNDNCKLLGGYCVSNENECEDLANKEGNDVSEYFEIDDDTKCKKEKEKKKCCYSAYACLNKGGECLFQQPKEGYLKYDKWNCPSARGCYIKKGNYYSYLDYVQGYGGPGVVAILTQDIHPGESYAISFGSPTEKCGDACINAAKPGLYTAGAGAILFIIGTSAESVPLIGQVVGTPLMAWGGNLFIAGIGSAIVSPTAVKGIVEIKNLISDRSLNTIYLSTYNDAANENICEVVE